MRKVRRVALVIGALVALLVVAGLTKVYVLSPRLRPAPDVKARNDPETVARGKYLVDHVTACLACHSTIDESQPGDRVADGGLGAGRDFGALPDFPGRLRAPNLTPDPETGIGKTTDGELLRAIREGIGKDGHALFPQMPYEAYATTLGDDDALAIIAYLRSIPSVKHDPGRMVVDFPVSMFVRLVPQPVAAPPPPAPPVTDKLARGRWLLTVASCGECHDSVDDKRQKLPGMAMAGGQPFSLPNGKGTVVAPNITSDRATGIGAYSDAAIRRVLDEGTNQTGRPLLVMPWSYYRGMTNEDKDALVAALREVPAVQHAVAPSQIP